MKTDVTEGDLTELRSFPAPPQHVKDTIAATIILLGHYDMQRLPYRLTRSLLQVKGSDSIIKRMKDLNAETVPLDAALGARMLTAKLSVEEIQKKSMAAASLFVWVQTAIEAVLSKYGEEDIANTAPRV